MPLYASDELEPDDWLSYDIQDLIDTCRCQKAEIDRLRGTIDELTERLLAAEQLAQELVDRAWGRSEDD